MICISVLICAILLRSTAISIEGLDKNFPAVPRTGLVVASAPRIPPFSPFQQEIRAIKTGLKNGELGKIDGNTQRSKPIFIKIINKNLSTASAVAYPVREDSGNNGRLLSNGTGTEYSNSFQERLSHTSNEKLETNKSSNSNKLETERTLCTPNEGRKSIDLNKELLRFWNLALDSVNGTDLLDAFHYISTTSRNCSADRESTFYCREIDEIVDYFTDNKSLCNTSQVYTKCHIFHIDMDPRAIPFLNSTEYSCQEEIRLSDEFSTSSQNNVQSVVFSKASTIMFGEPENVKNSDFRPWTQHVLQKLNAALAQENRETNLTISEQAANNSLLLNQWIEFPETNDTTENQQALWRILKDYQQYGENLSNNLIRICTAILGNDNIVCTEEHYQSMCLLNSLDGCADEMLPVQMSTSCRQFVVQLDHQIVQSNQIPCELLDELSLILRNSMLAASRNASIGIVLLQLTRAKVTLANTENGVAKAVNKKWVKHADGVKLRNEGRTGISQVKIAEVVFFEEATTAEGSTAQRTIGFAAVTTDSTSNNKLPNEITLHEITSKAETFALEQTNWTDSMTPENFKQFDEFPVNMTSTTNSNGVNQNKEIATVQFRRTNASSAGKNVIGKTKVGKAKTMEQKPLLWEPFHMDCSIEQDEFNITSCSDWATAGYCLSNNATRFLWCRKTCLCTGPPQL